MDFKKFKAAMFDFDGTITEKGVYAPSQEMADALVRLARKMPIAFCTGRQLESFEDHGLHFLIEEIEPGSLHGFFENLYLMAENGSIGYRFNTELDEFEEFYRVDWPEDFIDRQKFMDDMNEAAKKYGMVIYDAHRAGFAIRTNKTRLHFKDPTDSSDANVLIKNPHINEVYELADKIYEIVVDYLAGISGDYEDFLHVGNAGIGVLICPAKGDKDNGIREFGEYLAREKGVDFEDSEFREIMVVGDKPEVGGNDHYFLRGDYGTAFSVGNLVAGSDWPLPVIDDREKRLLHAEGTMWLARKVLEV
jgi:HAD superfamily hydrolase (TIGR01484 family)